MRALFLRLGNHEAQRVGWLQQLLDFEDLHSAIDDFSEGPTSSMNNAQHPPPFTQEQYRSRPQGLTWPFVIIDDMEAIYMDNLTTWVFGATSSRFLSGLERSQKQHGYLPTYRLAYYGLDELHQWLREEREKDPVQLVPHQLSPFGTTLDPTCLAKKLRAYPLNGSLGRDYIACNSSLFAPAGETI